MMSEFRVHPAVLEALSGATVAKFLERGYMTHWPFAWTRKGWAWFRSARHMGEAA